MGAEGSVDRCHSPLNLVVEDVDGGGAGSGHVGSDPAQAGEFGVPGAIDHSERGDGVHASRGDGTVEEHAGLIDSRAGQLEACRQSLAGPLIRRSSRPRRPADQAQSGEIVTAVPMIGISLPPLSCGLRVELWFDLSDWLKPTQTGSSSQPALGVVVLGGDKGRIGQRTWATDAVDGRAPGASGLRQRQGYRQHMTSSTYSHDLAERILSRAIAPEDGLGGRLPTERALVAELGVTRTMVRHALARLEAEGRISREVGRGTFLRAASSGASRAGTLSSSSAEVGPADVMAARRVIEPQVLPLVVAWATQRDFDELRRCLAGGSTAQSASEFEVWDFALHHAIVAASRNQLLLSMYAAVERARQGEIWGNLKRRNDSRERRAAYQTDHVELVEALCSRELAHAVEVMDRHLARVQAHLLETGSPRVAG